MNTVYAQLVTALDNGPYDVVDMAKTLGIKSNLDAFCSITLGSVAVNNLEMTNAYSTLAAHGMRHRATPILDITRQNGEPIAKHFSPPGEQVIEANIADEVTYALRSVVTGGTGYAADLGWPYYVYGKTGTAQDNVDAWFCGYTQETLDVRVGRLPEGADTVALRRGRARGLRRHDPGGHLARLHAGGDAVLPGSRRLRDAGTHWDEGPVGAGCEPDPPAEPDRDALALDRADTHG